MGLVDKVGDSVSISAYSAVFLPPWQPMTLERWLITNLNPSPCKIKYHPVKFTVGSKLFWLSTLKVCF